MYNSQPLYYRDLKITHCGNQPKLACLWKIFENYCDGKMWTPATNGAGCCQE